MKQLKHQTNGNKILVIVEVVKTTKKLLMRLELSKISVNQNLDIRREEIINKKFYPRKINTTILQSLTNPHTKEASLSRLNNILRINFTQIKSINTTMSNTIKNITILSSSKILTNTMMKHSFIAIRAIHSLLKANLLTEKFTK